MRSICTYSRTYAHIHTHLLKPMHALKHALTHELARESFLPPSFQPSSLSFSPPALTAHTCTKVEAHIPKNHVCKDLGLMEGGGQRGEHKRILRKEEGEGKEERRWGAKRRKGGGRRRGG